MWIAPRANASGEGSFSISRAWSTGGPISCSCGAQAASSSGTRMRAAHLVSMSGTSCAARSFRRRAPPCQLQEDVLEIGLDRGEVDDLELAGANLVQDVRDLGLGRPVAQLQLMRRSAFNMPALQTWRNSRDVAGQDQHQLLAVDPRQQIFLALARDHLAVVDDGDAVAQLLGFLQIVRGEEHRDALAVQLAHIAPQLLAQLD